MSLKSLSIPDQLPEIGVWLDELLVSPNLVDTIVEIEVLAGDRLATDQSLDGVLAGADQIVFESGLAKSDESVIRGFLRQPSLLLKLQEQVLMHGGDYWQYKADAANRDIGSQTIYDMKSPVLQEPIDSSPQMTVPGRTSNGSELPLLVGARKRCWQRLPL